MGRYKLPITSNQRPKIFLVTGTSTSLSASLKHSRRSGSWYLVSPEYLPAGRQEVRGKWL